MTRYALKIRRMELAWEWATPIAPGIIIQP